jgi:hypothetical protein
VVFIALSADSRPHFTTIAEFIPSLQEEITPLFRNVLMVCAQEGLIGQQMFAVDGCRPTRTRWDRPAGSASAT